MYDAIVITVKLFLWGCKSWASKCASLINLIVVVRLIYFFKQWRVHIRIRRFSILHSQQTYVSFESGFDCILYCYVVSFGLVIPYYYVRYDHYYQSIINKTTGSTTNESIHKQHYNINHIKIKHQHQASTNIKKNIPRITWMIIGSTTSAEEESEEQYRKPHYSIGWRRGREREREIVESRCLCPLRIASNVGGEVRVKSMPVGSVGSGNAVRISIRSDHIITIKHQYQAYINKIMKNLPRINWTIGRTIGRIIGRTIGSIIGRIIGRHKEMLIKRVGEGCRCCDRYYTWWRR